jgi:hypothetical protein
LRAPAAAGAAAAGATGPASAAKGPASTDFRFRLVCEQKQTIYFETLIIKYSNRGSAGCGSFLIYFLQVNERYINHQIVLLMT